MIRAVLDTNVLISALLSPSGAPARLLDVWEAGAFELVLSPKLIEELDRTLQRPKLSAYVAQQDREAFVVWLRRWALVDEDDPEPPRLAPDAQDDFLVALTMRAADVLVTGDLRLLDERLPITALAPRAFLDAIEG